MNAMLLKDYNTNTWLWSERDWFDQWLTENPSWGDAEIVSEDIVDNFQAYYRYNVQFLLKYKNRHYNLIISTDRGRCHDVGRRKKLGVVVKRYYMDGEARRKSPSRVYSVERVMTWRVVNHGSSTYNNDCQLWAFAKLNDLTYEQSHEILATHGWEENDTRMLYIRWQAALKNMGKMLTDQWCVFRAKKGVTLKNVWKVVPKEGRYAILVRGHVMCAIDGVLYDSTPTKPYARIERVYKIENI